MRFFWLKTTLFLFAVFFSKGLIAQVHPSESLGRIFFESLKTRDFNTYFSQSIFFPQRAEFQIFSSDNPQPKHA